MPQSNESIHGPSSLGLSPLRRAPASELARLGCADTLREILQQPGTWRETWMRVRANPSWKDFLTPPPAHVVLTGSGSSCYVGECLAPALQAELGVACRAVAAGALLTDFPGVLPPGSGLLVSIARSGDSPESAGVVDAVLARAPAWKHLILTCHAEGKLATRYRGEPRVRVVLLDPATNDRSLVMTSSFTNLVLAGSCLGERVETNAGIEAAAVAMRLLDGYGDALAEWAERGFEAMVCLGDGAMQGAAREAGLKLLEMSGGAVRVLCETSLGLRHGPMAWFRRPSQMLAFLSGDPGIRAYESDLLREMSRKQLGLQRIVVGEDLDAGLVGAQGLGIDLEGLYPLPAAQQAMVHVVAGQLLALFCCLSLGQRPDAPSQGVLTRVVETFALHQEPGR